MNTIHIKYTSRKHELTKAYPGDSGYDLCAYVDKPITISPSSFETIGTGISLSLPLNIDAQVRPRSGLARKHGITVLNSPGTIDNGYRGEIQVILINLGKEDFEITDGLRIAQIVFSSTLSTDLDIISNLNVSDTVRNIKGFGSSDPI
jgi:dUTP pyrophosphatase